MSVTLPESSAAGGERGLAGEWLTQLGTGGGTDALRAALQLCAQRAPDGAGLHVARRLKSLGADDTACLAALLSDPSLEDIAAGELERDYGVVVCGLVGHVRWLNSLSGTEAADRGAGQAERIRRMVLAMVDDARAVLIRLGYRWHRLQTLAREPYDERRALARETLDIYTPLANRLGLGQLKWEMEDLAFRYLEPQAYKSLADALAEKRTQRERYLEQFVALLRRELEAERLEDFELDGRPKHIYSIWRKMQRKQLNFSDLFDVRGVRVLVSSVRDCYLALGVVHSRWMHIPSEFDDYIANPKRNGYRSLHTAIVGPEARPVEVQIRTRDMHRYAELGVAAHWQYKEGGRDETLQRTVCELRALLEEPADDALLENFRSDFYPDRVFVLTPQGEVVDLPLGATPLDFAYHIHTQLGHRCRGAQVNGHIVNLRHRLHNGDRVDILTAPQPKPSRDWLNRDLGYLVSPRARGKVRHWFNQQDHAHNVDEGRAVLERELRRLGRRGLSLERLCAQLSFARAEDLMAALGRNALSPAHLAQAVEALERPAPPPREQLETRRRRARPGADVQVRGVGNLLSNLAHCCNPVPFDPIVGYITRGSGVSIHRADCRNALRYAQAQSERLIEVDWGESPGDYYAAAVRVIAYDRRGLLSDIAAAVAAEGVAINSAQTDTDKRRHQATVHLRLEVHDFQQLRRLLEKIHQVRNVIDVEREG